MLFRILADATVVFHLVFVLFVLLGGILVTRWSWVAWAHVPAAAWGVWIEFVGWQCPLTPLENWFRQQGGGPVYKASFIEHYLLPILYPPRFRERFSGDWVGGLALLLNAAVYILMFRRRSQK